MKTYKNLFPQICDFENLYQAFRKARRGKRRRLNVIAFEVDLEDNLLTLQEELLTGTYQPGAYQHFTIYDSKPRRISAAPFRDRVVHHALISVIEPIWERRFIDDSYACRVGKGTHAALDRCSHFARRYAYVLQCDVMQYFASIDHAILMERLARRIADKRTLALCQLIIDSGAGIHHDSYQMRWFAGDDLFARFRPRGLPIGNQTSQFWANVYLHQLDQFIKQELRCRAYLRYVDDFLLFADDKATLHRWKGEIQRILDRLRVMIHPRRSRVYPVRTGIPFLGFVIYPDHRRLRRSAGISFARRFRRNVQAHNEGQLPLDSLKSSVHGWIGHTQHGDTYGLRGAILSSMTIKRPKSQQKKTKIAKKEQLRRP